MKNDVVRTSVNSIGQYDQDNGAARPLGNKKQIQNEGAEVTDVDLAKSDMRA